MTGHRATAPAPPPTAVHPARERARRAPGTVARGAVSGALGTIALAVTVMPVAEIAAAPTAVDGIRSSTWTPLTGIAAVAFGEDAFRGSFAVLPILAGTVLLLLAGAALGIAGAAWIAVCAGPAPDGVLAVALGVAYGLFAQVAIVNGAINATGDVMYRALPSWGWWAGLAAYGAALGLSATWWGARR